MECNKDEAVRSKWIAESKLEQNDFAGAIKFALKAQALYPRLEGISQMLTTLDVHVSAEIKINGEVDWYGVLRVDPTADDETIKKQYKRLALVLHPDKNKSAGADGAFKLIFEAKSLLMDKEKRTTYDLITGRAEGFQHKVPTTTHAGGPSSGRAYTGVPEARTSTSGAQPDAWAHSDGPSAESPFFTFAHWAKPNQRAKLAPKPKKKTTKAGTPGRAPAHQPADIVFWTSCHHCMMQFEYLTIYRNTFLVCPNCNKTFMSLETPQPIGKSPQHKPKPWPPHQHNSRYNCNNLRTPPAANDRGKNVVPDGGKSGTWETGSGSSAFKPYKRGPLFGEPSTSANAAHYTQSPDASDGMEGLFKKQKLNDHGGLYGNNYNNVAQGDVDFGNASAFGSTA